MYKNCVTNLKIILPLRPICAEECYFARSCKVFELHNAEWFSRFGSSFAQSGNHSAEHKGFAFKKSRIGKLGKGCVAKLFHYHGVRIERMPRNIDSYKLTFLFQFGNVAPFFIFSRWRGLRNLHSANIIE